MDKRTFITCLYTATESVYSNKEKIYPHDKIIMTRCDFVLSGQSSNWQKSVFNYFELQKYMYNY